MIGSQLENASVDKNYNKRLTYVVHDNCDSCVSFFIRELDYHGWKTNLIFNNASYAYIAAKKPRKHAAFVIEFSPGSWMFQALSIIHIIISEHISFE
jgi:hypothetical protein